MRCRAILRLQTETGSQPQVHENADEIRILLYILHSSKSASRLIH